MDQDATTDQEPARDPALSLPDRTRGIVATGLVSIAIVHVFAPKLAIDAIFLGLLAFAGLVLFFDIDRIEWLGIKARRRQLKSVTDAVRTLPISEKEVAPPPPPPASHAIARSVEPVIEPEQPLTPPIEPIARLLWGAEEIKKLLTIIAGNAGRLESKRTLEMHRPVQLARVLAKANIIPTSLARAVDEVVSQRNAVAHAQPGAARTADSAANLAMEVLNKLYYVKTNFVRVVRAEVPMFADRSLMHPHQASPGVMVETLDHEGRRTNLHVFPTTRRYSDGMYVTWEWDFSVGVDQEAWYANPSDGTPTLAFSEAAYFAGREYPRAWDVQFRVPGPMKVS